MSSGMVRLILELVDLSVVAIVHGRRASDAFGAHMAQIRQLVAEGRDPTPEEVEVLCREVEALWVRLHAGEDG